MYNSNMTYNYRGENILMSKTFAINAGSSSLKFQLYNMPEESVIAKGLVERIGINNSVFTIEYGDDQEFTVTEDIATHGQAVDMLFDKLEEFQIITDLTEITGVGHRVVAGGEIFKESTLVTAEVIKQVEDLGDFAPLHNPAEAEVMHVFEER